MEAYNTKIKDLNDWQRGHLAWRLDHKTYCGYISAILIAKGKYEFMGKASDGCTLFEVFKFMDLTDHSAKIHSFKVVNFKLKRDKK